MLHSARQNGRRVVPSGNVPSAAVAVMLQVQELTQRHQQQQQQQQTQNARYEAYSRNVWEKT